MRIRVPTGFKQLQLTAQRKGLVGYRCTKCGKTQFNEICVKTTATAQYHVFGGEKARANAENNVRQAAIRNLNILDDTLFDAINTRRDYSKIREPMICKNCGEKQIWSTIPAPWKEVQGRDLWIIGICFSGMFSFSILALWGWFGLFPLSIFVLLLILPLLRRLKRKKALEALQKASFQPPKYYNHSNINELEIEKNF